MKDFMYTYIYNFTNAGYYSGLGDHDTSKESDCRTSKGKSTCAPLVVDVAPEQVFLHQSFSAKSFSNDIALNNLANALKLTPFELQI